MKELTKEEAEKANVLLTKICDSNTAMGSDIADDIFDSQETKSKVFSALKTMGIITVTNETENDPFYLFQLTEKANEFKNQGGFSNYEKETLDVKTIEALKNLINGESYPVHKGRPKEVLTILSRLENLGLIRKNNAHTYGIVASSRPKLKKLTELKSWESFMDYLDNSFPESQVNTISDNYQNMESKRYVLYVKTTFVKYNVICIDVEVLGFIVKKYFEKVDSFMLGGTKYFLSNVLEFKIFEFDDEHAVDRFISYVNRNNLKSKTIYGDEYFDKSELAKFGKDVSSKFLDSLNTEKKHPFDTPEKESMIDIFISHSSTDKEKVKLLINILRSALNLSKEQIRCTSVAGFKLTGGTSTDHALKQEIVDCKVFIGVLTENSIKSTYVLFELGARWGLDKPLKPLICEPSMTSVVKGPLTGLHCLNGSETTDIIQLVEECGSILDISPNSSDLYLEDASQFAELSKKKVDNVPNQSDASNEIDSNGVSNHTDNDLSEVRAKLLAEAEKSYPNDFDMQEFELNKQLEAYKKLINPPKKWTKLAEYNWILKNAERNYPLDYDMQIFEIEKQVDAYFRLREK